MPVEAHDMRPRQIDRHFLSVGATHSLGFVDGALDRLDGRFGIDDYAFSQAARLGLAHAKNLKNAFFARPGDNARYFARAYVQPNRVI